MCVSTTRIVFFFFRMCGYSLLSSVEDARRCAAKLATIEIYVGIVNMDTQNQCICKLYMSFESSFQT